MSKLTRHQSRLIAEMLRFGESIMLTRTPESTFFSLTGGRRIGMRTVQSLIHKGAIRRTNDGLFPGDTQTYCVVENFAQ